jgi:hypothetical protein
VVGVSLRWKGRLSPRSQIEAFEHNGYAGDAIEKQRVVASHFGRTRDAVSFVGFNQEWCWLWKRRRGSALGWWSFSTTEYTEFHRETRGIQHLS